MLPVIEADGKASVPCLTLRTGETILLVDDHASARHSMHRILHNAGYRILQASSGKRALKIFAEHCGEVDLLVADWMMPDMDGRELANRLRQQKPGVRVLLISGFHHDQTDSAASSLQLIRKPFSGAALMERIREVLDAKGDLPC